MHVGLLQLSAVAYLIAAITLGAQVVRPQRLLIRIGAIALGAGFGMHAAAIFVRYRQLGVLPVTTFYEGLSFLAWLTVGIYIAVGARYRLTAIGAIVSPLAFVLTVAAALPDQGTETVPPMLRSPWLPVHVTLAFLGNAVFAFAFAISVVYLLQEYQLKSRRSGWLIRRLPSLEQLDRLNYRCLVWGFPLLSLGIVTGAIWASNEWGRFWSWEPREVLSLFTWLVYAGLLQFRLTAGLRGRRAATLTIVGFTLVVVSYLSVNLLPLPGLHGNFGS
ncbi:MAG: c-type cytochrome biogenesis protein CcsB [Candidatus Dadabacteria bacterium]|nr:MAG: c-type cytochrome biogenesis protein CcsB [Candidatus Dadabacteria bacterium]